MISTNEKTYVFMAGLPRAGSTMLSSILNQNPKIYSGPSSPVLNTMSVLEESLANDEFFNAYPKPEEAGKIIANVIQHFYSDVKEPVIIDKNRGWLNKLHYIEGYFGIKAKVLVSVRNMDEILASFISMHRRNEIQTAGKLNFIDEMLVKNNLLLTDENRCNILANAGIVGMSYQAIRQALTQGYQKNMHFIEYDNLINNPICTMRHVYEFLEMDFYEHDFNNLKNVNQEKDEEIYGFKDMHEVRPALEKTSLSPKDVLPKSILESCKDAEFWREVDINTNEQKPQKDSAETSKDSFNNEKLIGA